VNLERRTPLKRTGFKAKDSATWRTRSPLRQRSERRAREMRTQRVPEVQRLNAEGVTCQVCPVLQCLGIRTHCARKISGLHERRKSSSGGSRENPANLVPACSWGNGYIEDAVGRDRGLIEMSSLVVRQRDPEWDSLGRRAWRER